MSETPESFSKNELYRCLQCAVCTGSCPVSQVIEGYNPRETILQYLLHGEQQKVLDDELVWCCTTCYACQERCPHEIDINGLLTRIMNQAARHGNLPKGLREGLKILARTGRQVKATSSSERIRRETGLAPLTTPDSSEIRQLLREAGLGEILELE